MFNGELITGPKGGAIAMVTNGQEHFEIQPMGEFSNREFYSRPAAQWLADRHALYLNERGTDNLHSSFVRR